MLDEHNHHPSLGYRSIRKRILDNTGWIVSNLSVYRSMQRLNVKALPRKVKYHYFGGKKHKIYENHLNRDYTANYPFEKIATDITMLMNHGNRYYLSLFFDLFNNSIASWKFSTTQDNHIIMKPAMKLLNTIPSNYLPSIIHSDQGAQFASLAYSQLLKANNITQSMSRAGNPRDNAVAESLIGHFKDVLYFDYDFRNVNNPVETIKQAVEYFNYYRPAFALDYKSPAQFSVEQGFIFFMSTNC